MGELSSRGQISPLVMASTDMRWIHMSNYRFERVKELLNDRDALLPVWVRAPKEGPERYTGIGRSKLYELNAKGKIRSVSIRERGQLKGTRLFDLRSILRFLDSCEKEVSSDESST